MESVHPLFSTLGFNLIIICHFLFLHFLKCFSYDSYTVIDLKSQFRNVSSARVTVIVPCLGVCAYVRG